MATETQVSYNSESSEFASTPATIYELIDRLETLAQDGRMRGTGRSVLKLSEVLGLIEDLKREVPKITSISDQIMMKRDEMVGDATRFAEATRGNATREAIELRQRAEDERNIIIAQAKKQASGMLEQSSVVKASRDEAEKIIEEAKTEAEKTLVRAKRQASTIVDSSEERAYRQIMETDEYSRKLLMKLEERLSQTINQIRQGIDTVNDSMEEREKQHNLAAMASLHRN